MVKAAGNGYSPPPKATAPRFYSTIGNNVLFTCFIKEHYDKQLIISDDFLKKLSRLCIRLNVYVGILE
jgi:hypothetical protein